MRVHHLGVLATTFLVLVVSGCSHSPRVTVRQARTQKRPEHFSYGGYTYSYLPRSPYLPFIKRAAANGSLRTVGQIHGHPLLDWPHLEPYRPNGPDTAVLTLKGWGGYPEYGVELLHHGKVTR